MAMIGTLGVVALMLGIDVNGLSDLDAANGAGDEVLGQVEVRGQQRNLSDGRTARIVVAASGLSIATPPGSTPTSVRARTPTPQVAGQLRPLETWRPALVLSRATRPAIPVPTASAVTATAVPAAAPATTARAVPVAAPAATATPPPPAPPTAPAPTAEPAPEVRVRRAPDTPTRRGEDALALIAYPWSARLPGWTMSFEAGRADLRGLTYSTDRRIEIYVRDDDSRWQVARVVAHELGHAVDIALNSSGSRRRWTQQRGIDADVPWWPESGRSDFATGAGDFAECFASWQVGSVTLSQVAGVCTPADLDLVASHS